MIEEGASITVNAWTHWQWMSDAPVKRGGFGTAAAVVRFTSPAGVMRAEMDDGTAWWWDRAAWVWTKDTSRGWDALG